MNVLVIGSGGQLGFELMRTGWPAGTRLHGLARTKLDIRDRAAVDAAISAGPLSLVINAAAFTQVDRAEGERAIAFAVNRDGAGHVAAACERRALPLVHISTDYVFDGAKPTPYVENDPIAPINAYGESKAAGEAIVRQQCARHIIMRTSWLYGVHGQNFVKTMLRLAGSREEIAVVDDQWGSPTAAADLAAAIAAIAGRVHDGAAPWGTFHYCGNGATTWHGFAQAILASPSSGLTKRPRLRPIPTSEYPTPARRPANSRLDCSRIESAYGIIRPDWPTSVEAVLAELSNTAPQGHH
ncbi:MAG: dTDP-4-dehydrorhamnose reductase [Dongiaceae bacterium]